MNVIYPEPTKWWVKTFRFINVLDDDANKLSPVKINVWGANLSAFSTVFAGGCAWVTGHWDMLAHIIDVAPVVGGYLTHAHSFHFADKKERHSAALNRDKANLLPGGQPPPPGV